MKFRTETQILSDMVDDANTCGLISVDEETSNKIKSGIITQNQYVLDLATHAKALTNGEQNAEEIYRNMDVMTAGGEALDRLGRLRGVARHVAKPAMVDLNISLGASSEEDINIPAGTLVLMDEVVGAGEEYVTSEDFTLVAGTVTGTVRAESVYYGYRTSLPSHVCNGLNGFSILGVDNEEAGVNGVDIEEDEEYRQRIIQGNGAHVVGTKAMIEDYLENYDGINKYKLIPRYNGIGTLKIVCDTLASELSNISSSVYDNCMLITDTPPLCVLPSDVTMSTLTVTVTYGDFGNLSEEEVNTLIIVMVKTFVEGGTDRNGNNVRGMSIGEDFVPSKLVAYLVGMIPEVKHFVLSETSVVSVADDKWFRITSVVVESV